MAQRAVAVDGGTKADEVVTSEQIPGSQASDFGSGALRRVPIFQDLEERELEELAGVAQWRSYYRSAIILGPGSDAEEGFCVIMSGRARLYRLSHRGQEITLAYMQAGDIFGLVFIEPPTKPKSTVVALADDTVVCRIPRPYFRSFVARHPEVAVYAVGLVSRRLAGAYDLIEDLALHDTKTRLARTLGRLALEGDGHVVTATHEELALMVGTTREKVTKLLRLFRQWQLVSYEPHRRGIGVIDPNHLLDEELDLD